MLKALKKGVRVACLHNYGPSSHISLPPYSSLDWGTVMGCTFPHSKPPLYWIKFDGVSYSGRLRDFAQRIRAHLLMVGDPNPLTGAPLRDPLVPNSIEFIKGD